MSFDPDFLLFMHYHAWLKFSYKIVVQWQNTVPSMCKGTGWLSAPQITKVGFFFNKKTKLVPRSERSS